MKRHIPAVIGTTFILVLGLTAQAGPIVLLDRSPDAFSGAAITPLGTPSAGNWTNARQGQHFADRFSFSSTVSITGMSIYSGYWWGHVGDTVSIQLFDDGGGTPGALLSEFTSTISWINTDGATRSDASDLRQKFADFGGALVLPANSTYWIGMCGGTSAVFDDIAAAGLLSIDDGQSAWFNNDSFGTLESVVGDLSMRLYGNTTATPDGGATAGALLLSLLGVVALYRRRLA